MHQCIFARQKWLFQERLDFDNSFQNKTHFSRLQMSLHQSNLASGLAQLQTTSANFIPIKHINCFIAQDSRIPKRNYKYKKIVRLIAYITVIRINTGYSNENVFFIYKLKLNRSIAQLTSKECKAHCSDGVKTCGGINLIKQLLPKRLHSPPCQNQHRAFNFQASAHCVRHCPVVSRPCGCEALSQKKHFQS